MEIYTLLLVALGLSIDCFTISLTGGMMTKREKIKNAVKISAILAIVQTAIALLGWALGIQLSDFLEEFSSSVAVGLLALVGFRMIYQYFKERDTGVDDDDIKIFDGKLIPLLAVLVSFDELAAGVTFALLNVPIWEVLIVLLIVFFIMCFTGIMIGRKIGSLLKKKADLICGILFLLIAVVNLIEF